LDPTVYETEAGLVLLDKEKVLLAFSASKEQPIEELYRKIGLEAKKRGLKKLKVKNEAAASAIQESGLQALLLTDDEKSWLDGHKLDLIVMAKFARNAEEAMELVRNKSIEVAEQAIREASSRPDLHLVQAIQALDDLDKFLNNTMTRVSEWYSLHFPELTQMVSDNVALCKLVLATGRRGDFSTETLEGKGFTDKKVEAILSAAERSKGGDISDRDLERVKALAQTSLALNGERERLNNYVDSSMKKIAPNVSNVAGPTIGARLMAKAGGLDRFALLPASTIQILGAEKALFRALRTGARPPKHGILFQHQEVHTAPKWQRGKIARTIANKVAIAARIDYYRGSEATELKGLLEERLEQIKIKYKEPPKRKSFERRDFPRKDDRRKKFRR
jgi:nucleolar protein 56